MSQTDAPQSSATQPAEPQKASSIRLIVLLAILAVVLTGFLVDMFWMYDSVKAASVRLQAAADETAERPREEGKTDWLSREEVAQAIGFQPTSSSVGGNGQLTEHYRWWGSLPLQRRFIMVVYDDAEGTRYSGYEISNRNIYGQDEDEEAIKAIPPADPSAAPLPIPNPVAPMGITGPPSPSDNEPADKEESKEPADNGESKTPEPQESPSSPEETSDAPAEKKDDGAPAEKKDDSPE